MRARSVESPQNDQQAQNGMAGRTAHCAWNGGRTNKCDDREKETPNRPFFFGRPIGSYDRPRVAHNASLVRGHSHTRRLDTSGASLFYSLLVPVLQQLMHRIWSNRYPYEVSDLRISVRPFTG